MNMRPTVQVSGGDRIAQKLQGIKERLAPNTDVFVGVPKSSGAYEDGTPLAVIAAVHEFGATINHPGGTPYKIGPDGQAVFTHKGDKDAVGVTQPHTITIPERSFLRVPLRSNQDVLAKVFKELMPMVAEGQITIIQLLEQVGARAASISQEAIASGINPPNAPSTVRQKGSSTPLMDEGRLRQSITHVVEESAES